MANNKLIIEKPCPSASVHYGKLLLNVVYSASGDYAHHKLSQLITLMDPSLVGSWDYNYNVACTNRDVVKLDSRIPVQV